MTFCRLWTTVYSSECFPAKALLGQLRQSFDPMTQLPWSDALRDWGAEQLRHSNEIAVIFIDLNKFGAFNKQYGHVIGDKVLQGVVQALKDVLDPATDLLVRYGGDEFAIGTLRDRDEADILVDSLRRAWLRFASRWSPNSHYLLGRYPRRTPL